MPNAFMVSSLLSAIACLGLAGFATAEFVGQSDDCNQAADCLGKSVLRSRSAVGEMLSNWE